MNPYEVLDVDKSAEAPVIKRAYRRKAQKTHPDKGGSPTEFERVNQAYKLLSNPDRRAHYDATGETRDRMADDAIWQQIAALLFMVMDKSDLEYTDIVSTMITSVKQHQQQVRALIEQNREAMEKLRNSMKHFKKKNSGQNMLQQLIEGRMAAIERTIASNLEVAEHDERTLEVLADYEYETKEQSEKVVRYVFYNSFLDATMSAQ